MPEQQLHDPKVLRAAVDQRGLGAPQRVRPVDRELALFNLAIDSKLRACALVKLRVRDVCHVGSIASRTIVLQQKTQRPVQFEITEQTRDAVGAWIRDAELTAEEPLFPSWLRASAHLSTR